MKFKKITVVILGGLLLTACTSNKTELNIEKNNNKIESNIEKPDTNKNIDSSINEMKNTTTDKREEEEDKNKINTQPVEEKKDNVNKEELKEEIKNESESDKKDEVEKPKSEDEIIAEEGLRLFRENGYENMVFLNKTKLSSASITGVPVEIENKYIYQFKRENESEDRGYYYDNINKKILRLDQGLWKIINENNRFTNETYLNVNLSMDVARTIIEEKIKLLENESIVELREVQGSELEKIAATEVLHNIYEDKVYIVSISDGTIEEDRFAICARTGFIYDIKSNWNRIN